MKRLLKSKKKFLLIFCILIILVVIGIFEKSGISNFITAKNNEKSGMLLYDSAKQDDVVYLSDIPYLKAQIGWKTIGLDKTNDNANLVMRIDGSSVVVKKGIWAHATSTVDYDISNYKNYDYFTTYYGLNTSAGNTGNGVKFYIYTSQDGQNWTLRTDENPTALKGVNNAVRVKIDIKDANYIRLYAYDNGSNASDHAVWGDAKLVKEGYNDNAMMTVEDFDKIIKSNYQSGSISDSSKLTLLQRNFIKNVGQYQLRTFLEKDPKNYETLNWFINNEEALRLWTIGGKPNGTYEKSLQVLSDLYHTYKEDLSNENLTQSGIKYKDLYLKMMLSLSLTHSTNVGLWIGGNQLSDAVIRYDIYKQMHLNNKLASNSMFESYTIDEMRGVMITNIDDEEILWLRDYSLKRYPNSIERFLPTKYVNYTFNYGYYRPQYYSQENYAKWDAKYNLSNYKITYQSGKPKLWIVFEEGAVCGGISKTAANLYGVWGYPGRVVGQPAHAAYIYLYNAGGGKYAWQLANSVASTGWANTGGSAINGWGTKYATNSNGIQSGSYILLSQEAQNEYEKYEKAELILLQTDVYKNDRRKLEQIYRDALTEENINLDAWIGLTDLYLTDETKTDKDLYDLAKDISEAYAYHPLPMYDSTRRIATKIKSPAYYSKLLTLQGDVLNKAAKASTANTIYYREVPVIAKALLGIVDSKIATFSFDGTDAGKIVLSKQLQSAQTNWSYSLDGGNIWKDCSESSVQLTKEEISSITPENDIKIHIIGLPRTEENIYTIDIKNGVFPSNSVSIDDFENHFNGTNNKMEWSLDPKGEWQAFSDATPLFKGDVVVYVRMIATGIYTTTTPVHYTFTTNASSLTNRFIPRDKISIEAITAGQNNGKNMLDGNINTAWFSKESSFGQGFQAANVILKLDEARYVSELDYVPYANAKTSFGGYPTGKARALTVQVSTDLKNWTTVAVANNLADNSSAKKITFEEPTLAKYVSIKFTAINNSSSLTSFVSVAVLNLYENPTVSEIPLAEVSYDIAKKTNKDVVAELVNENREITVTNNGGKKTHTFTENGEFTFEFVDNDGKKGSATAKVDWIDKTAPKLNVSFSNTELTNENVVATLSFDKENVTIISDIELAENPIDGSKILTFSKNDSIEIKFQDELGNIGKKTITVDWIDIEAPTAEFEYSTTNITDKEVVATLKPSEEVTITNNNGKDTYTFTKNGSFTFEFVDKAGNVGEATVSVNWIAKLPKYNIKYSTKELTKEDVKVVLELENSYHIFNNNASNEYIFTENGTFDFQYKDKDGNTGVIPVTVDWIDKENPTAEFNYSTTKWTNKNVVVTLKPSEEVTIINNDGKDIYTFTKNGEFTFEFVDIVGHKGTATAKVDWIDKEAPTAVIEYSTKESTKNPVIAKLKASENVTILGNGKSTHTFYENAEFTFEFVDRAGNKGYATAKVDWIEKAPVKDPIIKPGDNTSSSTSSVNKSNKTTESVTKSNKEEKQKETYKNMTSDNITVNIPNYIISKYGDVYLNYQKLTLSDAHKYRYGKNSDFYELSLITKDNEKVELSNIVLTQIIKLDSGKIFDAIYVVRDDDSVIKLNAKVNENNEVVFEDEGLGKYIISYKEEKHKSNSDVEKKTSSNDTKIEKKDDKSDYLPYVLGGIAISLIGGFVYFIVGKKL